MKQIEQIKKYGSFDTTIIRNRGQEMKIRRGRKMAMRRNFI